MEHFTEKIIQPCGGASAAESGITHRKPHDAMVMTHSKVLQMFVTVIVNKGIPTLF